MYSGFCLTQLGLFLQTPTSDSNQGAGPVVMRSPGSRDSRLRRGHEIKKADLDAHVNAYMRSIYVMKSKVMVRRPVRARKIRRTVVETPQKQGRSIKAEPRANSVLIALPFFFNPPPSSAQHGYPGKGVGTRDATAAVTRPCPPGLWQLQAYHLGCPCFAAPNIVRRYQYGLDAAGGTPEHAASTGVLETPRPIWLLGFY